MIVDDRTLSSWEFLSLEDQEGQRVMRVGRLRPIKEPRVTREEFEAYQREINFEQRKQNARSEAWLQLYILKDQINEQL